MYPKSMHIIIFMLSFLNLIRKAELGTYTACRKERRKIKIIEMELTYTILLDIKIFSFYWFSRCQVYLFCYINQTGSGHMNRLHGWEKYRTFRKLLYLYQSGMARLYCSNKWPQIRGAYHKDCFIAHLYVHCRWF